MENVDEIYIREARSNTEPKQILLSVSLEIFQILKTWKTLFSLQIIYSEAIWFDPNITYIIDHYNPLVRITT